MLRFGVNRLVCLSSSRSLLSSTTESVQQNVIQSGIKSVLACKIQEHQKQTICLAGNIRIQAYKSIRGLEAQADENSKDLGAIDQQVEDLDQIIEVEKLPQISNLEKAFFRFEERCQRSERVVGKNFATIFNAMTRLVEQQENAGGITAEIKSSLSMLTAILLRCCGKLMDDTPVKAREMLAANLWQFINEKQIPVDISHYNSLVRVLNENDTAFDPQKMLDEIVGANLKPDRITYQRLIHQHCLQGNIDGATILLEKMKELNMELHEATFASLIIGYSKQENPPSIDEIFELMKSNGIEPGGKSCSSAIIAQAKLLEKNPAAEHELKKIFELVETEEIRFNIHEAVDIVTNLSSLKGNETAAKIFEYTCSSFSGPGNMNSRYRLFNALFAIGDYMKASEFYWSIRPPPKAILDSNLGIYYIRLLAHYKHTPIAHCLEECGKLKETSYNKKAYYHLYYFAAQNGNLDLLRATIAKIGEHDEIQCNYYWPLIAQSKDENELVNVLKNDLNPSMRTNDLVETFATWVWPRFENNISRLFDLNKELNYPSSLLMTSYLTYAVQSNKVDDAIKFVSEAPHELVESSTTENQDDDYHEVESDQRRTRAGRNTLIGTLLRQIAEETKDPSVVNRIFSLCKIPGQQLSARHCSPLVRVHIQNNDYKSAFKVFFSLAQEHRITPSKSELIRYCLEQKDSKNLQKIMDVSTGVHGETNSLFDLAICCIQTGRLKQAQKILANPGMRVNPIRVYRTAQLLGKEKNLAALESFVNMARDLDDVNQENLYQILINAYEDTSSGSRALDLWNRMQEEEFQPSRRSLAMLARVLERNNIEVPFKQSLTTLGSRRDQ